MIVIITQCFLPRIGGIETVMSSLADAIHNDGEKVIVLADSKGDLISEARFDKTKPYVIKRFKGLKFIRKFKKRSAFKRLLQQNSIEVIFTDSWKSNWVADKLQGVHNVPLLCFAHGNEVLPPLDYSRKKKRIIKAFSCASKIIAISKSTEQLVHYFIDDKKKCSVIYNMVKLPSKLTHKKSYSQKISSKQGSPTLITLGRIEPRKGHDTVIRSLPEIKKKYPKVKYWIVGSGDNLNNLKKLALKLNVSNEIVFWGNVDASMKELLLANASLMVMPNRYEEKDRSIEGFGLVFIEAAYHNLPIIAGKSGGASEAVIDKETGILSDGHDLNDVQSSILKALDQPEKMKEYAQNGYTKAIATYKPEIVIEQYKQLWKSTVEKN